MFTSHILSHFESSISEVLKDQHLDGLGGWGCDVGEHVFTNMEFCPLKKSIVFPLKQVDQMIHWTLQPCHQSLMTCLVHHQGTTWDSLDRCNVSRVDSIDTIPRHYEYSGGRDYDVTSIQGLGNRLTIVLPRWSSAIVI